MKIDAETAWLFWSLVDRSDGPDACWPYYGSRTDKGYGHFHIRGELYQAHRFALHATGVEIPAGHHVDHLCRVPWCVNPTHLEPVTPRENTLRGVNPTAVNATKTRCENGHPFDEANTFHRENGWRGCRECRRIASLKYVRRVRAERKAAS